MSNIYSDIATRTQGDIYLGVVGPVRSGKSTFIKSFLNTIVLPNISGEHERERAVDEMPQSSGGRTIMTTEPKFIPEEAVEITFEEKLKLKVRLVDCVGYVVPSSIGYVEEDSPRMVKTPWYDHEIPFNMAAEMGTKKVITEHSTIGVVVTTDGSISDIPRAEYEEAEERVIDELKAINKPFVVLLNCVEPNLQQSKDLADSLSLKYGVPVIPVNCLELGEKEIGELLSQVLYEFPVKEIAIGVPGWLSVIDRTHPVRQSLLNSVKGALSRVSHIRDIHQLCEEIGENENVTHSNISTLDLAVGSAYVSVEVDNSLFYSVLGENTGFEISTEQELFKTVVELAARSKAYEKILPALEEVERTGYGIVMPDQSQLKLEEPEMTKQGGRYGVRLKASAPSIHLIRTNTTTEVCPIVGSESQSEDLVVYLMKQFEENPTDIWKSDIFGKSIYSIVNEGLNNKLYKMPSDAREKLRETVERVINEGCNGLICIIL